MAEPNRRSNDTLMQKRPPLTQTAIPSRNDKQRTPKQ